MAARYGAIWCLMDRCGARGPMRTPSSSFPTDVTVEGKPLAAGIYGLHMIPGENEFTVIFSKMHTAWGSFSYKESEDALRVTVKPQPAEMHNALTYDFDELKPDSAVVVMSWDKLAVPFKVSVDVNKIVEASLNDQMRGLSQYTWDGWDDAATYLVDNKVDLPEALKWEDNSIGNEDRYENEMTKSRILKAMGKDSESEQAKDKALSLANVQQLYAYGRQLQRDKKQDEAFKVFKMAAAKEPNNWLAHAGLARVACGEGNFDEATKQMQAALVVAPDNGKASVEGLLKKLQQRQNINN